MRSLSETLLAAQRQASMKPSVKLVAKNKIAGVTKLNWERLYSGPEDDYYHAITMPGDGSLVRVRLTPPSDSRKLYRQRVAEPDPQSDFSQWVYSGQYNAVIAAAACLSAEVSIFWIKSDRKIQRLKSSDYGATWSSPELIDYSPTTAINGIAAAYKPNGDIGLFFADQQTLYVKKYTSGQWQANQSWDKTSGELSGVAASYDGDWKLFLTGQDSSGDFKLWSLVYGDGGEVAAGTWSGLKEFASAPSGGDFEYRHASMDKPDVYRAFYVEKFSGSQAYSRPFWSHSIAETGFTDSLWHEPVPFDLLSEYGLAISHHGDYGWLSAANGVWRALLTPQEIDLTADVRWLKQEAGETSGRLTAELSNAGGGYNSPGAGELKALDIGCQLELSPGYATSQGNEFSPGPAFALEAYEHLSSGGRATLRLQAADGWGLIQNWRARHQFRFNKDSDELSVKDILAFVLARVGLKLEVKSQSSAICGFYPDFSINPGSGGQTIISKLLSFVPDVIFVEGGKAYLVNPQAGDSSVYTYGSAHVIFQGRYRKSALKPNRIQVEGHDPVGGGPIIVDRYAWDEIDRLYDRLRHIADDNIATATEAEARGDAYLRQVEIAAFGGAILVPVNCGQQLCDVIDITDGGAGLDADKRRVLGMVLLYNPGGGDYQQQLLLGAV